MPTYVYRCENCQHAFSVIQHMAEHGRGPIVCPQCGSQKTVQVFAPFFARTSRKS